MSLINNIPVNGKRTICNLMGFLIYDRTDAFSLAYLEIVLCLCYEMIYGGYGRYDCKEDIGQVVLSFP